MKTGQDYLYFFGSLELSYFSAAFVEKRSLDDSKGNVLKCVYFTGS